MGKKKFKMPTNKHFLKIKRIADPKKDPVWVYLENEMRANIDKKPYNKKVGSWLAFLKNLKRFYRCQHKSAKNKLLKEAGPRWFTEFSPLQRTVLQGLSHDIHCDEIIQMPINVRRSLSKLGMTRKFCNTDLMGAVSIAAGDPGIFLWHLFEYIYKVSPSVLRPKYDLDAMIIMSCFVFIDLEECIQILDDLTKYKKKSRPVIPKKKKAPKIPDVQFGVYLQKNHVKLFSNHGSGGPKPRPKPKPLGTKCRFRSEASYTVLRQNHDFIEKRKRKNKLEIPKETICPYKFWEPPSTLRNTDPTQAAYVEKLKLLKKKATKHFKTPLKNFTYEVAGVSFLGDHPQYILSKTVALPTGYTIVNSGIVAPENKEGYTNIQGHWSSARKQKDTCHANCDCLDKWEQQAFDYAKKCKCYCNHNYDFYCTGKCRKRYFNPPTRTTPHWFDEARVFKMDPLESFVKGCVKNAVRSDPVTPNASIPSIPLATVSKKKLLKALLADISDTHLFIPHLPQAHLLNNLLEWVRNRVRGKLTPKQNKKNSLISQRRWLQLKHLDFRANTYFIPFTLKQLKYMSFKHRDQINKLVDIIVSNFVDRNRQKQVEQARLMWPTTKYDAYPQKAFLDMFFTYMPSRIKDSFLINPYSSEHTAKYGAKTCPLER